MTSPACIYFGALDDMIAEVAAFDPRTIGVPAADCAYVVLPVGEEQFDTEWFASRAEARRHAEYLVREGVGAKVAGV